MHFGRLTVTLASLVPHVGARSSPVTQPQTVQGRDSESHHRRLAFPPVVPHWTTVLSSLYPESSVCSSPLIVCFPYTLDGGFRLEPWSMPGTAAFNHHQHPACKWLSGVLHTTIGAAVDGKGLFCPSCLSPRAASAAGPCWEHPYHFRSPRIGAKHFLI